MAREIKIDYYFLLEVEKNATSDEIKLAYRRMAIKYHPDKNPGDAEAEERFKEIAEAYSVLNNEEKRTKYDRCGDPEASEMGFDDIFNQFADVFSNGNSDSFGGHKQEKFRKGDDFRINISLSLEDVENGVEKQIVAEKMLSCKPCDGNGSLNGKSWKPCSNCLGTGSQRKLSSTILGEMQVTVICQHCKGSGKKVEHKCTSCRGVGRSLSMEECSVTFPRGINSNSKLEFENLGHTSENGHRGKMIVTVDIKEDVIFDRLFSSVSNIGNIEFFDLKLKLRVKLSDLMNGSTHAIQTIRNNQLWVNIPKFTQSGFTTKIENEGLSKNENERGNLFVEILAITPESEEELVKIIGNLYLD